MPVSIPTLKRPRPTSQPPSPSSSSSPKRAASEDNFATSSDSGRPDTSGFLSPNNMHNNGNGAGSSPLRLESEPDEGGWVKRTEDVHLGSSVAGDNEADITDTDMDEVPAIGQDKLRAQYDQLLAAISPPYKTWARYYIIPADILNTLKTLALDPALNGATSVSLPRINLNNLLKDTDGEDVYVIQSRGTPASNSNSLTPEGTKESLWRIKDGLEENEDFTFISSDGWRKLVTWYGPYNGPSLPRFCTPGDRFQMVPPVYTLYLVQRPSAGPETATEAAGSLSELKPLRVTCPSETIVSTFLAFAKSLIEPLLPLENSHVRLWTLDTSVASSAPTLPALGSLQLPASLLPSLAGKLLAAESDSSTCAAVGLEDGDIIAIEIGKKSPVGGVMWAVEVNDQGKAVEKAASTIPVPQAPAPLFSKPALFSGFDQEGSTSKTSTAASSESGIQTRSRTNAAPRKGKGLVGLINLGNTCFMNSAVQCLSNTQELSNYFLSGVYREELNPDNPLGMNGQIAEAFGLTVENLWAPSGAHSSYSPRQLKYTTGRFAPQFAGYGQHDTQEFIAFLLDGLHEDLNRIKKKPYIEKPDWKPGGGDRELAELGKECWEGYKKRNDSVIVDLFQGQLRSTLVCPECHKESITLDPFMYLTVPLPISQTRVFKCIFVPLDREEPPVKVKLLIPQNASFMQVKEKLASMFQCKASNIVGFDLWKGSVYAWWIDADHNSEAKDNDVAVFYELPVPVSATRKAVGVPASEQTITVPVYTFRTVEPGRYRNDPPSECATHPFFISLTKAEATDPVAVRDAITKGYSRLVRPERRTDMWVPSGSRKAAVALPAHEDEEPVTEIHLDGDNTRVVEVPPRGSEGSLDPDAALGSSTHLGEPQRNGSFASISDAASVKSSKSGRLVPRGDLFKVHVADASSSEGSSNFSFGKNKDPVIPFYKGNAGSASATWSRLEDRRKAKKTMLSSITSGFRSMVGSSYASDDEASPPATPVSPPLVVRPGEGIFCEWSIKKFNDFFDSSVTGPEEEIVDPAIAKEAAKKKEGKSISIEDCLDEFSKEETLGQDDLWYCPQCKKHQAATKKLEIYQAPDILVICIKRFGSSRRLSDKLDNFVSFPIEGLDLGDRIGQRKVAKSLQLSEEEAAKYAIESGDEPLLYDLYAVDNHFGGMGGGHYTAFCRNRVDDQWYNYDDSRVSKAGEEAVQSRAAYLLFYRRRTSRPIGGISRVKVEEASRAASPIPSSDDEADADAEAGPSTSRKDSSSGTSSTDTLADSSTGDNPPLWSGQILSPPRGPRANKTLDGDGDLDLPEYSATNTDTNTTTPDTPPTPASPNISDDGSEPFASRAGPKTDLGTIGQSIGFGNTAWGRAPAAAPGIQHEFGVTVSAATDSGSEDGFERIRVQKSGHHDDDKDGSAEAEEEGFEMISQE